MNNRLKEIRQKLNLTQKDFSSKLGISQNRISNFENSKSKISNRDIASICGVFNINKNWFMNGDGEIFNSTSNNNISNTEEIKKIYNSLSQSQKELVKELIIKLFTTYEGDNIFNCFNDSFINKIKGIIENIKSL